MQKLMSLKPTFFLSSVAALKNVVTSCLYQVGGKLFCKYEQELNCAAASRD